MSERGIERDRDTQRNIRRQTDRQTDRDKDIHREAPLPFPSRPHVYFAHVHTASAILLNTQLKLTAVEDRPCCRWSDRAWHVRDAAAGKSKSGNWTEK